MKNKHTPGPWSRNGGHNRKPESWWINQKGYVEGRVWVGGIQLRVKRHRWVMEACLGRPLLPTEDVHHRDGNKQNNDPSNLEILSHGRHSTVSNKRRTRRRGFKMKLTQAGRAERSQRAKNMNLSCLGLAAIAKAEGRQV